MQFRPRRFESCVIMGRQKADIDPKLVEGMASVGATNTEIANFLEVDEGTIRKRFSEVLLKARSNLKIRLRRKQIELALAGDKTMLIWLGKQYLDQKEKSDMTSGDEPMATSVKVRLVGADDDGD